MFCGCFAVFRECFAVFPQNTQNTPEKHRKTLENTKYSQYARVLRIACVFQEPEISTVVLHKTIFTKHLQNTAKHRKTQTVFKTLQNSPKTRFVFCEITSQNTAK